MRTIARPMETKINILGENSYFRALPHEGLMELARNTTLRAYERGEIVFWEGEPCAGLHILQKGSVKLFKTSTSGRELIIKIFEAGATFNEVPVFDNGTNPVNVAALEACEIWLVDGEVIRTLMVRYPQMCQSVIQNLAQNLRMLVELVDQLSFYQVTHRLARLLSQLPREQLSGGKDERITQDQLAARLGTVREVVARSLRELERSGAIRLVSRKIEVVDPSVLESWAQPPQN